MIEIGCILTILFAAWGLTVPMRGRPMSEDDGYWFYYSVFREKGLRLFQDGFRTQGYFGLPWIFACLRQIFGFKGTKAYQTTKAVWYGLTAVSVFCLGQAMWQIPAVSLAAALLFLVVVALPDSLFSFTYAEHFYLLPLCAASALVVAGGGSLWSIVVAGVLMAWGVQIKVTFLPVAALFPIIFPIIPEGGPFWLQLVVYVACHAVVLFLPFALIPEREERGMYLHSMFGPVLHFLDMHAPKLLDRLRLRACLRFGMASESVAEPPATAVPEMSAEIRPDQGSSPMAPATPKAAASTEEQGVYVRNMQSRAKGRKWDLFMVEMWPVLRNLWLLLVLAAAQLPLLVTRPDPWGWLLFGMVLVFAGVQQAQQNYHMPHLNPVWVPVSLLAGKTLFAMWQALPAGGTAAFVAVLLVAETVRLSWQIARSYLESHQNETGLRDQRLGFLFRFAEVVGEDLARRAKPGDRLLVWGDQPSIHIASEVAAFNRDSLFMYAHSGGTLQERELFDQFRLNPPEWVLFYNWRVQDGKDMAYLSERVQIPYREEFRYVMRGDDGQPFRDEAGFVWDFPLYRRDDDKFFELLMDRSCLGMYKGYFDYRKEYELAQSLRPEDTGLLCRIETARQGDYALDSSRERYAALMEETPDRAVRSAVWTAVAESHMLYRDPQAIADAYQQALRFNPASPLALAGLGRVMVEEGMFAQSFGFLAKAFSKNPHLPSVLWGMAHVFEANGDIEKAREFYRKARAAMPSLDVPEAFREDA